MTEIINGSGGNGASVQTPAVGVVRSGESVVTRPRVETGKIIDIAKYRETHPRVEVKTISKEKESAGKILSFAKQEGVKNTWKELAKNNNSIFKSVQTEPQKVNNEEIPEKSNLTEKEIRQPQPQTEKKVFEGELVIARKQQEVNTENADESIQENSSHVISHENPLTQDQEYQDKVEDKIREAEENGEDVDIEEIKREALEEYQAERNKILEQKPSDLEQHKVETAERVAQLEQQIAIQQEQINKLTESLEKTQDQIQKLAEMNAELAMLMMELLQEEDEEKKEDIAAKILKLMTNLVGIFMQSLVDPDKAQAEAAEKIKESGPDEVDEPSKNDPEIAERIRQYQELMKERQQAERVPQEV